MICYRFQYHFAQITKTSTANVHVTKSLTYATRNITGHMYIIPFRIVSDNRQNRDRWVGYCLATIIVSHCGLVCHLLIQHMIPSASDLTRLPTSL